MYYYTKLSFYVYFVVLNCINIEFFLSNSNKNEKELRYVYYMFRHGARSPNTNKDVFGSSWNYKNILTSVGKRGQYIAGLEDRLRYKDYLNPIYSYKEVNFFSTEYDRTIESLESRIQGLYSQELSKYDVLSDTQKKNSYPPIIVSSYLDNKLNDLSSSVIKHNTQFVSFNILNKMYRYDLYEDKIVCPGYSNKKYRERNDMKESAQKILSYFYSLKTSNNISYLDILKKFYNFSHINLKNLDNYQIVYDFCDAYISNFYDGRDLFNSFDNKNILLKGDDLEKVKDNCLEFLRKDLFDYRFGEQNNYFIAKLDSTNKLREILNDMKNRIKIDNKINNIKDTNNNFNIYSIQNPKLKYYSAHDSNLASLINIVAYALQGKKIENNIKVSYISRAIFELKREVDSNNESKKYIYYVHVYFNNFLLFKEKFNIFNDKINKIILDKKDILSFCEIKDIMNQDIEYIEEENQTNYTIYIITISFLSLMLFIILISFSYYKNTKIKQIMEGRSYINNNSK